MKQLISLLNKYDKDDKLENVDKLLRKMIKVISKEHFEIVHKEKIKWTAGSSYISHAGKVYDYHEMNALIDSALDFWLTTGRYAKEFSKNLSNYLGIRHCILTNSGSSANLLAISALTSPKLGERKLKQGDEVITVAASFPTTVNPIVQNGLIPVFCDINLSDYNIITDQLINAITPKTKAIVLAHTLSIPFNVDLVMELKKKYNLWVIEDNCDALGSKWGGKFTGTFGDLSTCSFFPAHHITMGEGGAVLTNSSKLKRIVESFRDWGRDCWCDTGKDNTCGKRFNWKLGMMPQGYDHKFIYSHIGYNLKSTDMQAAVGVEQLKKLPEFSITRVNNWNILYKRMLIYKKYFLLPELNIKSKPNWYGFPLIVRKEAPFTRNEITKYLDDKKIRTRLLFSGNITMQPYFENIKYRTVNNLKNTNYIMENMFWFGCYPAINEKQVDYIIDAFDQFILKQR